MAGLLRSHNYKPFPFFSLSHLFPSEEQFIKLTLLVFFVLFPGWGFPLSFFVVDNPMPKEFSE